MATGPQQPVTNPPPVVDNAPPSSPVSWEGDKMFNIYIYDYCVKRGYQKTARELIMEADIPPDSLSPPINAKQGLLFEWWSVFWVLFSAKSSGNGSEDALLYTQASQQRPNPARPAAPQRAPYAPRQVPVAPGGGVANGVGPSTVHQGPMPNGASYPTGAPQPNGAPPSNAGPSSQPMLTAQRPGGPQQRAPNGIVNGPYQSPTMAHSPQNPGPSSGSQPGSSMGGPMGPNPSMNRGAMLPPNGPQSGPMGSAQQTPQPAFQQISGPSASNPGSPAQAGLRTAPSPSMAARQPPGPPNNIMQDALNAELNRINPNYIPVLKQEAGLGNKDLLSLNQEEKQRLLHLARQRGALPPTGHLSASNMAGPSGKNIQPAGPNQQRPIGMAQAPPVQQQSQNPQQRSLKRNSTSPGEEHAQLPRNESSPPSNKRPRTSPSGNEQQQQQQHGQQQPPQPPQQPQPPPMTPMMPFPPHPQQQNGPPMMRPLTGPPLSAFPSQPMQSMVNTQSMGGMSMGPSIGAPQMNPGGMMNPGQMMYRQQMHTLHKNGLPQGGMNPMMPGGPVASSPAGADQFNGDGSQSRPGTGMPGQFGVPGGPNSRLGPGVGVGGPLSQGNKMMPPPSPSMNSVKNPTKPDGPDGSVNVSTSSPRNAGQPGSNQPSGMSHPTNQGTPSGTHTAPPTPIPSNNTIMTAPSPSSNSMNNSGPPSGPPGSQTGGMNPPPMTTPNPNDLFGPGDFTMSGFEDLDPTLFRPDGVTDFERDFGEWFNPGDVALDLSRLPHLPHRPSCGTLSRWVQKGQILHHFPLKTNPSHLRLLLLFGLPVW
ncbi:hypothetical protein ABKN59_006712 [Abortiporus biennis]